jgi:GGDEF domain-containing protein
MLLIEDAQSVTEGEAVASKIVERMRQPMVIAKLNLNVTCSIGVGFSTQPQSAVAITDLADRALYAAKQAARNTFRSLSE